MSKRIFSLMSLLLIVSLLLASCAQPTPVGPAVETQAPEATQAPGEQPTEAQPTEVLPTNTPEVPPTTRHGGWADTLVYTSINEASDAVAQLKAGAIDIYSFGSEDTDAFNATVEDENLDYTLAIGNSVDGYMFNPAGPTFNDGR